MAWPAWPIDEDKALARYVLPEMAAERVRITIVRDDEIKKGNRLAVVRAIYEALWNRDFHYARELYAPEDGPQPIRDPGEMLTGGGNATCLDLALLFAGVCLGHELLPLVVIVEGHAFAAVSLLDDPRVPDSAARIERDGGWVNEGVLRDCDLFERLIADKGGHYVPIECTGFAKTETLTNDVPEGRGREGGKLDFAAAVAAARAQCTERKFRFAVDPALRQRVKQVTQYEPLAHSVGQLIGGDVIGSILVSGNHSQVFVGDYERLRDAYIEPWSVFQRVRLDRFVGREWVIAKIDEFLARSANGYFVLEAKAGLGKTALLAHVVRERAYVHHFVELAPGPQGVAPGLKNLAAQLIRGWSLNPAGADDIVPGAATRPDYLERLLLEASRHRDEVKPGEKIVLVVDALDEAGALPGQNAFGLPRVLPNGVYFIVSCRPLEAQLSVECPRSILRLEAQDANNLADMRAYIESATKWPGVAKTVAEARLSLERFCDVLLQRCAGVWIYLHYVLSEVERGERSPLDVEDLPKGLWQYYARFWHRWRTQHSADWDSLHLPLLATLAAVEKGQLGFVCDLAGVIDTKSARRLFEESWSPFVAISGGRTPSYHLYHASLRDFLSGRADLSQLTSIERAFAEELARATEKAHSNIADRYLDAWGGLKDGLPQLIERAFMDNSYGFRTVVAHLVGARRRDDFDRLLRLERSAANGVTNTWYEARDREGDVGGYVADLASVHRAAQEACEEQIRDGRPAAIAREIQYALMSASIRSLGTTLSLGLLAALLEHGVWSPIKALAYARNLSQPKERSLALSALSERFPEQKASILRESLEVARTCDSMDCAEAIATLSTHLPDGQKEEVLSEALSQWSIVRRDHYSEAERARILGLLAPQLPPKLLRVAFECARGLEDLGVKGKTLAALAPSLPDEWRGDALAALGDLPRITPHDYYWREAVVGLFPYLPEHARLDAWHKLSASNASQLQARYHLHLVARLWRWLPEPVCLDALRRARHMRDPHLLEAMLPHAPPALKAELAREAVSAARRLPRRSGREALIRAAGIVWLKLFGLTPPKRPWQQKLRSALANRSAFSPTSYNSGERGRVEIVAAALPHIRGAFARTGTILTALRALRRLRKSDWKSDLDLASGLSRLAESLPAPLLGLVVRLTAGVENRSQRAKIVAQCACRLPEPEKTKMLARALDMVRRLDNSWERREGLLDLSTHLNGDLRARVLAEAASAQPINDEQEIAETLGLLAPGIPSPQRETAFRGALAAARTRRPFESGLRYLFPHLPEELLPEALDIAKRPASFGRDEKPQGETLEACIPYLPPNLVHEALAAFRETKAPFPKTKAQTAIIALRSRLNAAEKESLVQSAYADIRNHWPDDFTDDLVALAPYLPPQLSNELRSFALEVFAKAVESNEIYSEYTIRRLIPVLPTGARADAFRRLLNWERADYRGIGDWPSALGQLAPHIPEELLPDALAAACKMDAYARDVPLKGLAPRLPPALLPTAIAAARKCLPESHRAQTLGALAGRLQEPDRSRLQREALSVALSLDERSRRETLQFLAPLLVDHPVDEILGAADEAGEAVTLAERMAAASPSNAPTIAVALRKRLSSAKHWRVSELDCFSNAAAADLYALWKGTSAALAASARKDACAILQGVRPVIFALGGEKAVADTSRALRDVARWWP